MLLQTLTTDDVTPLTVSGYYDGPVDGLCSYGGFYFWYERNDDNWANSYTFDMYDLTLSEALNQITGDYLSKRVHKKDWVIHRVMDGLFQAIHSESENYIGYDALSDEDKVLWKAFCETAIPEIKNPPKRRFVWL